MKKEVIGVFLVFSLIFVTFTSAQFNSIEIKDVDVNENQLQVLVNNNLDKNFNKITFIINNQYTIIQDEILSNFTAKFFIVNYPPPVKLETIKVIVGDQSDDYVFTGNEDTFVINQAVSQTSELTQVESNSPISYIYSGPRVAKIQDGNIIYFQSDNVGSTSIETDNIGNIEFKANYLPFGKELSFSSQGKEKYGFTSKEYDAESSLNYFNARYYNPSIGKFISNDPIFKPTEGGYQYVRNNPLTITDPSGKQMIDISKLIEFSFKIVENQPRYIPKQCIERCQLESDKLKKQDTDQITKAIEGFYQELFPALKLHTDYFTTPFRRVNLGDKKVEEIGNDINNAVSFLSEKLGSERASELVDNLKGVEFVKGGLIMGNPATTVFLPKQVMFFNLDLFTNFKKELNDPEAFNLYLSGILAHESGHITESETPIGNFRHHFPPWAMNEERNILTNLDPEYAQSLSREQLELYNKARKLYDEKYR